MKKQAGFGAVELLIVLVVFLIVGGIAYVVYDRRSSDNTDSSTKTSNQATSNEEEKKTEPLLSISEWDVGLRNEVADKLTSFHKGTPGTSVQDGDAYESFVILEFKEGVTSDMTCGLGLDLLRSTTKPKANESVKLGKYYYWAYDRSVTCENDEYNALQAKFFADFDINKLESL